jgi:[phosphatase 2A protein]-leucine-carboxy methyltransferase
MSSPQIPNLNTLRRGAGRGRGRGRGYPADVAASQNVPHIDKDKIVQRTDFDAATSRLSAVECGYLDDPFAKLILPGGHAERRLPLMNRGALLHFHSTTVVRPLMSARNMGSYNSHRPSCRQIHYLTYNDSKQ